MGEYKVGLPGLLSMIDWGRGYNKEASEGAITSDALVAIAERIERQTEVLQSIGGRLDDLLKQIRDTIAAAGHNG